MKDKLAHVTTPITVFLCLFLTRICSGQKDRADSNQTDLSITIQLVKDLLTRTGEEDSVAIVRFETEYLEGLQYLDANRKGEKPLYPETALKLSDLNGAAVHFQGTFSLVKRFRGEVPKLGKVSETINLRSPLFRLETDDVYKRLRSLLLPGFHQKRTPVTALAIWPKDTQNILDGTFVGPLSKRDIRHIDELAQMLDKEPFSKIEKRQAEMLLESPNPWKVYLGLGWLEDHKALDAQHFASALKALPSQSAENLLYEMLELGLFSGKQRMVARALGTAIATNTPDKQLTLLRTLNEFSRQNRLYLSRRVDVAELQRAAAEYRASIVGDAKRRDVVKELDALLQLRLRNNKTDGR